MSDPVLRVENINVYYGSIHAIKGISFDVYEGEHLPDGKKQIAVQVVIQSMEKTLTDAEIETLSQQILNYVAKNTGAELRK